MKKFEYKIVKAYNPRQDDEDLLNKLGKEGWKFVFAMGGGAYTGLLYFERELV